MLIHLSREDESRQSPLLSHADAVLHAPPVARWVVVAGEETTKNLRVAAIFLALVIQGVTQAPEPPAGLPAPVVCIT